MTSKITLRSAVTAAVKEAVRNPEVPAQEPAVRPIVNAVLETPEILHATNSEPWFASRVTIGALAGLIGGSYGLVLDFLDGTLPTAESLTAQVVVIGGAALTLYGRWFSRAPIGS